MPPIPDQSWFRRNIQIHGWVMLIFASFLYVLQGSRDTPLDAVFENISQYELGADSATVGATEAAALIPWNFKFLIGLVSDNLPIFGYNAKPYIMLMTAIGILSITSLGLKSITSTYNTFAWAFLGTYWYGAIADCLGDSLIIKSGKKDQVDSTSGLQSLSWFSYALGASLFNFINGQMGTDKGNVETDNVSLPGLRANALLTAAGAGLFFILLFFVKEERTKVSPGFKTLAQQFVRLFVVVLSPPFIVLRVAIWIILAHGSLVSISPAFRVYNQARGITPDVLANIEVASNFFMALGVAMYYKFFRHTSFRTIFATTQVAFVLLNLIDWIYVSELNTKWGISDVVFLFTQGGFGQIVQRLNSMPFLVLAGQLCPDNMEATFFALIMSVSNQGTTLGKTLGSKLLAYYDVKKGNFGKLINAIWVRTGVTAVPLLFIMLVPNTSSCDPSNADSLNPTNPYIIRMLKWVDLYNPHGDKNVEDGAFKQDESRD